ncbi:hypothetical protein AGIG_G22969 [Arapaima gigas]
MPRRTFSLRVSLHVPARRFLTRYPSHLFLSDGLRCRPSSVSASRPGAGALRPPKFGCEVSVGRDRAEPNRAGRTAQVAGDEQGGKAPFSNIGKGTCHVTSALHPDRQTCTR